MTMPARMRVVGCIDSRLPIQKTAAETMSARQKADTAVPSQACPKSVAPKVIASAAPKLAADEIPSVEGLARALEVMFWISRPASANAVPTNSAVSVIGSRIDQTITASIDSPPGPAKRAPTARRSVRSEAPTARSATKRSTSTTSAASTIAVRCLMLLR